MKNNNKEKLLNALYELNPQFKVNPLLISLTNIKKHFESFDYNNKPVGGKPRNASVAVEVNKYNKICKDVIDLIDIENVTMPQHANYNHKPDYLLFSYCVPTFTPKQQIAYIKKNLPNAFTGQEKPDFYISIFQAVYLQIEEVILNIQKEYLLQNTAIKLPSNELRVYTYFKIYPDETEYNCADYLGLMPIQVFGLKQYPIQHIQIDECKPFIYSKIVR